MRVPRRVSTRSRWISSCDDTMGAVIRWLVWVCAFGALPLKAAGLEFGPVTVPVNLLG